MYTVEREPWTRAELDNGVVTTPLITLRDGYGGVQHIIEDDHCFVLINGNEDTQRFKMTCYWNREPAKALADYLIRHHTFPSPKEFGGVVNVRI